MTENDIKRIADLVIEELPKHGIVQIEVSARHVHLSQEDLETLFGKGAKLTEKRPLSQPGQYLAEERITLAGKKSKKENVAVLGPVRPHTQVELSKGDCLALGVDAPVRESGDVQGSGSIELVGPRGTVRIDQGAIIAHNHIHLTPETAKALQLKDKAHVQVKVNSGRPLVFQDVIIRVSGQFANRMHIDSDEANAADISGTAIGTILL
ncbi:phosphate propanoyltransferase [Anaerotruncus rubiinfantis]|uniref:phosphate propanoyltransferase n=1 Tax=Anaerotruncus rubiinfantis TaxID=1720200 RepID=UPI000836640E|nr:phosphate propanoyltransferase [Anaerotruncus rubiinfantis]